MADRTLKVFGHINHLAHNYDMLKLVENYPIEFYYLENNVRRWGRMSHRPMPAHLNWVQYYEKGKYDLAILHLDQQVVENSYGKSKLYRELNETIQDIPKIVINHGTPMWPEKYDENIIINGGEILDEKGKKKHIDGVKDLVGDNFMVVNSYEAANRWGWGYPVIHGLDPNEWLDLPKEPRVILPVSPAGLDKYYNRQLHAAIKSYLPEKTGLEIIHPNVNYNVFDWNDYKELLGRSLIAITPFRDSPMPRSRTEAMLSGCCILTSRYHGADEFIEHGKNGLILPDNPLSYVEAIEQLINFHYKEAIKMGQEAKKTAEKYFKPSDYQADIYKVIKAIANGENLEWDRVKRW